MFLIPHGSYTIALKSYALREESCNNCKTTNCLIATKYANVKHVFFLPVIFHTHIEFYCNYCQEVFELNGLDKEKHSYYKSLISFRLPPIWLYPFPIIILVSYIVYLFNVTSDKAEMSRRLIETPMNRILEYKVEPDTYSALKIIATRNNNYLYFENELAVESEKYIDRILDEKYFVKDTLSIEKQQLERWIEEGKVTSVHY